MLPRPGKPKSKSFTDNTVYHPSIYSYKCRGAYSLSSDEQQQGGREGICRGLRTRLELLADMEPGTRENAIKSFTYMTDYDMDESDANSLNQKTKSILVSPAIIYKEEQVKDESKQSPPLLEEELIKRQDWSCYGSTEIDLLILKNEQQGTEHIAAVAPRNVGLSIRKIQTDDGNISSIAVGWVNIVVDSGPLIEEDQEQQQQQQQPSRQPASTHASPQSTNGQESQSNPATPVPHKPFAPSFEGVKTHLMNVYDFSFKVKEHMKYNLSWLSGTLQDDFPSRCMSSGKRIVAEIPKTVNRTALYMGKMYDRWANGDDENDSGHS